MQNVQLSRASHALAKVREVEKEKDRDTQEQFLSAVRALPAEIRMNGLGQAIAMLRARGVKKCGAGRLYEHVSDWMCGSTSPSPYRGTLDRGKALLDAIVDGQESSYRLAYAEIDAYLMWLKRFADAFLDRTDEKPTAEVP